MEAVGGMEKSKLKSGDRTQNELGIVIEGGWFHLAVALGKLTPALLLTLF